MEATKPDSGGVSERGCSGGPAVSPWVRAIVPGTGSPVVHWTRGAARVCPCGSTGGSAIGIVDDIGVRGRRCFPTAEDPLDVVACDRWAGHWFGRSDFSASTRRWLRHDRWATSGERDHPGDSWSTAREMVYLGGV